MYGYIRCGIFVSRLLLSNKKESSTDSSYDMDKPWKHYAEENKQSKNSHIVWFHLYEMSEIGKSVEIQRKVVAS